MKAWSSGEMGRARRQFQEVQSWKKCCLLCPNPSPPSPLCLLAEADDKFPLLDPYNERIIGIDMRTYCNALSETNTSSLCVVAAPNAMTRTSPEARGRSDTALSVIPPPPAFNSISTPEPKPRIPRSPHSAGGLPETVALVDRQRSITSDMGESDVRGIRTRDLSIVVQTRYG